MSFRAACIQNSATPDVAHDIAVLARLIRDAAAQGAGFVATPEYCAGLDTRDGLLYPRRTIRCCPPWPRLPANSASGC